MDPIVDAVIATGKVHGDHKSDLQRNLLAAAEKFQGMVAGATMDPGTAWWPSRLRLDVLIGASGQIVPGTTLGGDVKVRFDWFPTEQANSTLSRDIAYDQTIAERINKFFILMAQTLEGVNFADQTAPKAMPLNMIRIALGVFGSVDFGVAKGNASLEGSAYFVKRPKYLHATSHTADEAARIPIVELNPPHTHLRYAKQYAIPYQISQNKETGDAEVVYYPLQKSMQDGLTFANNLGIGMLNRLAKHPSKNWQIGSLRNQFTLSLGGWTPVVTIGGAASLQFIYTRQN